MFNVTLRMIRNVPLALWSNVWGYSEKVEECFLSIVQQCLWLHYSDKVTEFFLSIVQQCLRLQYSDKVTECFLSTLLLVYEMFPYHYAEMFTGF